jgi:peptidyl-prolyl cis-trans isomerase SurA
MKKLFIILIMTTALFTLLNAELVDKIIARVGSDIILLSDLNKQINQMKSANMYPEGTQESDVLGQMIESRLIIQKAKELNYTVDESKIKAAAEARIKQIKSKFDSEEAYQRELRGMKLTNSDLIKYFSDLLTEQALTQQFYQKQIAVKVNVTDKEMRDFYVANRDSLAVKPVTWNIGMIMRQVEPSEATDQAQLKAIRAIQEKLKSGANFADLAREYSDCPSAERGGDLGFFSKGMMVKPFEDAAFALKVGEVSDVVKTQYGYHLIKLEEKRDDEIRVSHILKLVEPSAEDSTETWQLMESIRQQFLTGTSFALLAQKYSMDKDSAKDGGSIGEYSEKDFPDLFAPVLKSLTVGGITDVLQNEGIYYLFTKINEIPSRILSFDEVKDQIKDVLSRSKEVQIYNDWIKQLQDEFNVEITL